MKIKDLLKVSLNVMQKQTKKEMTLLLSIVYR